ncbi:MAG: hypothetical protein IJ292_03375 [Clostridia bacterium]|nr:hypothetical protein [Clostridia bacterium]
MMKIMSRNKIALMAVLVSVMMVMSMMAVSAAPVADAGVANDSYAAESVDVATLEDLHNAMVKVETENVNVTATLKEPLVYDPAEYESFVVGTDATSEGVLTITGNGEYGITLGAKATLHIKGNVTFENIILDKPTTASAGDYMNASYIFVTEGKGTFGEGVTNPNAETRATKVSIAGSNLEVLSGQYMVVAANFYRSGTDVENTNIVFGGTAETEILAGRGVGTGASPKVTGLSSVTIQGSANVTNVATAGYYRPVLDGGVSLAGNATLTMNGGTVNQLFYAGYVNTAGTANFAVDANTRSLYTININGGTIKNYIAMYSIQASVVISGVDATVSFGNAIYGPYEYTDDDPTKPKYQSIMVGPMFIGNAAGSSVTNCKVTANINRATFNGALYGGYINAQTDKDNKVELKVDLVYNIGQTSDATNKVTFGKNPIFGICFGAKAEYSEYSGIVEVNLWPVSDRIRLTPADGGYYGGSELNAPYSKHTGKTTINIWENFHGGYNKGRSIYGGSIIAADNAVHSGVSTVNYCSSAANAAAMYIFGGSKITKAGIHSGDSFVIALSGAPVANAGNADLLNEGYVFGGSYLQAEGAIHSGNSKVIFGDKATNKQGTLRHDTFGGSYITASGAKHTGTSEVLVEYGAIQNQCNVFGGSYLEVSGAIHEGASAVTIKERVSTSSAVIGIYGGSYIKVGGAKHTGTSTFEFNAGTMNNTHGAGSYAATGVEISGHGSVYYKVNGGTITISPEVTGNIKSITGNVNVIITGGMIKASIATLSGITSVNGNSILKISGGTFTCPQIDNGTAIAVTTAGENVVTGTFYTEFVGDSIEIDRTTAMTFQPAGRNNNAENFSTSSVYIRYIGEFNHFGDLFKYNFGTRLNNIEQGKKFQDYTQCTADNFAHLAIPNANDVVVFYPMNGQTVTVTGIGEDAKLSDYVVKAGDTLTWGEKEYSYDDLIAYNSFTEYKNEFKFVDATTLEDITIATRKLKLNCGEAYSAEITPSNGAIAEYIVSESCEVKGFSIRAGKLAMRCRFTLGDDFFANFFGEDEKTAIDFVGFKVKKIGIKVSANKDLSNAEDAVAWEDNAINVKGGKWVVEDGVRSFAAALGYLDENGDFYAQYADRDVYFKAYVILVDTATNAEITVDIYNHDTPAQDNVYAKSLNDTATKLKEEYDSAKAEGLTAEQSKVVAWFEADEGEDVDIGLTTVTMIINAAAAQEATFNVVNGAAWCNNHEQTVTSIGTNNDNLVYKLNFDVNNAGYVVSGIAGVKAYSKVEDNVFKVEIPADTTEVNIEISYARKTSTELEARRNLVLAKMQQITGFRYTVDRDYSYTHGGRTYELEEGKVYQGMPYSDYASLSFEAFMDFETTQGNGSVPVMSFRIDEDNFFPVNHPTTGNSFFPGNSCADAVFWSWGTVASGIKFFSSKDMVESKGVYLVGDIIVYPTDFNGTDTPETTDDSWKVDTKDVCTRNGQDKMAEAYALMATGDALVSNTSSLNHTILVGSVEVKRNASGVVNPSTSYILYYDQNGGYEKLTGENILTCCSYNVEKTFTELYSEGYLPVTCIELLDDSTPLAKIEIKDSVIEEGNELDYGYVTAGKITTNYALSTIKMEIKDATGDVVQSAVRYGHESPRLEFQIPWFKNTSTMDSANISGVYSNSNVINKDTLAKGTYTCVVTGYFSNGEPETIREFTFTK